MVALSFSDRQVFASARGECEESPDTMESRDRVIPGVQNRERLGMESAAEKIPPLQRGKDEMVG